MRQRFFAGGLVVGLVFFTGCSIEAIEPGLPEESPVATVTVTAIGQASESASTRETEVSPSKAVTSSATVDTQRAYYTDSVDVTLACPTGELVIDGAIRTTVITQACAKVTVKGPLSSVLAEHVGTLIVAEDASSARVLVRSVDKVVVKASSAEVYWDKGSPASVEVTGALASANPNPTPEA